MARVKDLEPTPEATKNDRDRAELTKTVLTVAMMRRPERFDQALKMIAAGDVESGLDVIDELASSRVDYARKDLHIEMIVGAAEQWVRDRID